jgi:predicted ATPase
LVIGPNGSGKTSLLQALLQLRALSQLPPITKETHASENAPRISFQFSAPHEELTAELCCVSDQVCDALRLTPAGSQDWAKLQAQLRGIRAYLFDHLAMTTPSPRSDGDELLSNGANLSAVLAEFKEKHPDAFSEIEEELVRIMPEFSAIEFTTSSEKSIDLALRLSDDSGVVSAADLSQGTLYLLAVLALAFHATPPSIVCIEEIDRGIHPRMLREVRDLLYRLSYPEDDSRPVVQVIATTHSPYLLDLFREHPEVVVISQKQGNAAQFECLADREDLADILAEGSLGDIWFSGILGGVPEES